MRGLTRAATVTPRQAAPEKLAGMLKKGIASM
jgi:hypothetical protein